MSPSALMCDSLPGPFNSSVLYRNYFFPIWIFTYCLCFIHIFPACPVYLSLFVSLTLCQFICFCSCACSLVFLYIYLYLVLAPSVWITSFSMPVSCTSVLACHLNWLFTSHPVSHLFLFNHIFASACLCVCKVTNCVSAKWPIMDLADTSFKNEL